MRPSINSQALRCKRRGVPCAGMALPLFPNTSLITSLQTSFSIHLLQTPALLLKRLHRRVGRLMRQNGISVVRTRIHKLTTDSDHKFNIAPNLLDRNFTADQPNQKWAGDISYVWTRERWLYLAVILDLHFRRVIGWAVSNRMKRGLAIRALKMALAFRSPPKGCIHQTDCGSQYCSHDYQKILRQHGFKVSMNGKGNYYDNASVKTFFKSIKAELIWRRSWETCRQAEMAISSTSTVSTIRVATTQHWVGKALSPSNKRWLKPALKRDTSKVLSEHD